MDPVSSKRLFFFQKSKTAFKSRKTHVDLYLCDMNLLIFYNQETIHLWATQKYNPMDLQQMYYLLL